MASNNDSMFEYSLEIQRLAADWCPFSCSDNPPDNPPGVGPTSMYFMGINGVQRTHRPVLVPVHGAAPGVQLLVAPTQSQSQARAESEKSESSEGFLGWEIDHAWDESKFSMLPVGVPRATVRTSAISPDIQGGRSVWGRAQRTEFWSRRAVG